VRASLSRASLTSREAAKMSAFDQKRIWRILAAVYSFQS
jgi:hypothetical protein